MVVGVAKDHGENAGLGVVERQNLAQQQRSERAHGRSKLYPHPAGEADELDRHSCRLPLPPDISGPGLHQIVRVSRHGQAREIALHVGSEYRNSQRGELLGQELQGPGFAGAGGPRDQPVAIGHGQRQANLGLGMNSRALERGAQRQTRLSPAETLGQHIGKRRHRDSRTSTTRSISVGLL